MINILESICPVIDSAQFVTIDEKAIKEFCKNITEKDLLHAQAPYYSLPEGSSLEEDTALTIVFNALNFCFWGEPKWKTIIGGKQYHGSEGTVYSLIQSVKDGFDILNPTTLKDLSADQLQQVFKGEVTIPLFEKRLQMLRELGTVVLKKYNGEFCNIIRTAQEDALKIVELLAKDFPTVFNDVAEHHGKEVQFFKRAQLVPLDLYNRGLVKPDSFSIKNMNQLTSLADYKIPMVLREFGILIYSPSLAEKVDNKIELQAGSDEEIEIRASQIWAVEKMKNHLQKQFPHATASHISDVFWWRRKEVEPTARPHHRVRTVWY